MEAIVEYNYEAREADELSLRKGDIIKNIKVLQGGWWEGTLKDKRGMFPDNFVKVLDSSSGAAGGTEMASSTEKIEEAVVLRNGGSGRKWCKVLFSYDPMNSDELRLVPQDSVEYLGEVEEGWWRGRINGHTGVFPSNFVGPPMQEEKQIYRVLFPYEAVNEDELTLAEGDIITLLSKDAPDKGWWKGEVKGRVGLFPDNFVELIAVQNNINEQEPEQKRESSQINAKSNVKISRSSKFNEKAHARKSLDTRNARSGGNSSNEKKSPGNHSIISSLKRFVGDGASGNGSGNGTTTVTAAATATAALGEELDEVERGEGTPLSHLTASRAKAPRRRPPTTQHLRHLTNTNSATNTNTTSPTTLLDENMTNGSVDSNIKTREEEGEGIINKVRRSKAPWVSDTDVVKVEELKLNQMERKRLSADKVEKLEAQKDRVSNSRLSSTNIVEAEIKPDVDSEEVKTKDEDKTKRTTMIAHKTPSHDTLPSPPGYVQYHMFNQLLEKVGLLEENLLALQRTVNQLAQMAPNSPNYSISNKE